MILSLLFAKTISLYGLAAYLSIAVINNTMDKTTNRFLINQMLCMSLLENEAILAKGIIHRAIKSEVFVKKILQFIVLLQLIISLMLWCSAISFSSIFLAPNHLSFATNLTNYTLSAFMSLWFFFWCGGFWFGYWLKTPQIQEVHMKLILLSLLEIIFINI